ncbi:helix-turn-helix domain-containing protein [Tenacibaculum sp. SG-28]|uniref:helix-turn-helix domain-containing protein n=1 Tax=Tenacibaculum sp. SG-28 TaxID=754426 RepID=UPI000CF3CA42|nr:helix-turn-helix domain-containing protein [Tenacibaculum sp. SG-28]PQJ22755.1 hypothetical protein BSU00_00050 [Tenacibaculum sp. SG-28]
MNIKYLRTQKHLTQDELAQKSGISIRTIQRIEAGQEPKGHTAKALAKALDLKLNTISQIPSVNKNYSWIKIINLSSAFVCFIPLFNIIVPLAIMYLQKQINTITKQILSLQIFWSITSFIIFVFAASLKDPLSLDRRFPLWVIIAMISINLAVIFINANSLNKKKELFFKLSII